jgi:hypothetical protein
LAENKTQAIRRREKCEIAKCPECAAVLGGPPPCWSCGWAPKPRAREVEFVDGELGLVDASRRAHAAIMSREEQHRFYCELRGFLRARGKSEGAAFYWCRDHKGFTPPWDWRNYPPLEPSPATASWAKSRIIAYAKARPRIGSAA